MSIPTAVYADLLRQIIEAQDFEPNHSPEVGEVYEDYIGRTFVNRAKKDAKAIWENSELINRDS